MREHDSHRETDQKDSSRLWRSRAFISHDGAEEVLTRVL